MEKETQAIDTYGQWSIEAEQQIKRDTLVKAQELYGDASNQDFRKVFQEESLKFLNESSLAEWFHRKFSGKMTEEGHLIDNTGKETSFLPEQFVNAGRNTVLVNTLERYEAEQHKTAEVVIANIRQNIGLEAMNVLDEGIPVAQNSEAQSTLIAGQEVVPDWYGPLKEKVMEYLSHQEYEEKLDTVPMEVWEKARRIEVHFEDSPFPLSDKLIYTTIVQKIEEEMQW